MMRKTLAAAFGVAATISLASCAQTDAEHEWFVATDTMEQEEGDDLPDGPYCVLNIPWDFDSDRYIKKLGLRDFGVAFPSYEALGSMGFTIDLTSSRTVLVNPREMDRYYTHYGLSLIHI